MFEAVHDFAARYGVKSVDFTKVKKATVVLERL